MDIICGGSPCQDLSVAGQRAGLAGNVQVYLWANTDHEGDEKRRWTTNVPAHLIRPRYLVWETSRAFSSAGGEDFRAVIEEIVRINTVPVMCLDLTPGAGNLLGLSFWEIIEYWRVLDAPLGVAQRRCRIFLVADFGGTTAPEILFKQDSLFGDTAESRSQRQGTSSSAKRGSDDSGGSCLTPWDVQSRRIFEETGIWPALYGGEGGGHGYIQTEEKATIAFAANQRDEVRDLHDVAGALGAQPGMKQQTFVAKPLICLNDHGGERMDITEEVTPTLRAGMGGHPPLVPVPNCLNGWDTQQSRVFTPDGTSPTLTGANGGGGRNPAGLVLAAEVVSKGNGDCFLTPEVHTSITGGGGQAGQGYPCVLTAGFCGNAGAEARGIGYQAECSPTIKTGTAPSVFCLNDQGGSQMHCTKDITGTLRAQEHGHQPLIMATQQGGAELLKAFARLFHQRRHSDNNQPVLFDNHAKDCRYTGPLEVAPTVTSTYGTGGNNVPL